jgi:hypothetical protein
MFLFPEGAISGLHNEVDTTYERVKEAIVNACKKRSGIDNFNDLDLRFRPIVLFPWLQNYSTNKPPPQLRESYLAGLNEAVQLLNQTKIAHLDLRPENIMWRETGELGKVDMKIIDLETAVRFDR